MTRFFLVNITTSIVSKYPAPINLSFPSINKRNYSTEILTNNELLLTGVIAMTGTAIITFGVTAVISWFRGRAKPEVSLDTTGSKIVENLPQVENSADFSESIFSSSLSQISTNPENNAKLLSIINNPSIDIAPVAPDIVVKEAFYVHSPGVRVKPELIHDLYLPFKQATITLDDLFKDPLRLKDDILFMNFVLPRVRLMTLDSWFWLTESFTNATKYQISPQTHEILLKLHAYSSIICEYSFALQ